MSDHATQWGQSFRIAWRQATPLAQEAARKAAAAPDQAARSLSDAIRHALQLAIYAAEDLQRLQAHSAQQQTAPASSDAIRHAMDDIRKGRLPPEQSEKHLQHAVQEAARRMDMPAVKHLPGHADTPMPGAQERFRSARRRVSSQLAEAQRKLNASAQAAAQATQERTPAHDAVVSNCLLATRLDESLTRITELFLDNKAALDPVAPLPDRSADTLEEASCPTPRG